MYLKRENEHQIKNKLQELPSIGHNFKLSKIKDFSTIAKIRSMPINVHDFKFLTFSTVDQSYKCKAH